MKRLKPSTIRGYNVNLDKHILPYFSEKNVDELTVKDLDELTDKLSAKGLSNKSIVYVHATLRKMYAYAVKRSYVSVTPYAAFDLPRVEKYRHTVLNTEQIGKLLAITEGTEMYIPVMLAVRYGLRRGEILGIKPKSDIDFIASTLHIQRTLTVENGKKQITSCKTNNSDRRLLLADEDLKELKKYENKHFLVNISPAMIDKKFKKIIQKYEFPDVRFHDLRHSYATFMLARGVNPKIVSEVLGHSGIDITLDLYSHPDVSMQKACLQALQFI